MLALDGSVANDPEQKSGLHRRLSDGVIDQDAIIMELDAYRAGDTC